MYTQGIPRIVLKKTDGLRILLPADAISSVEEMREGRCRVNTMDGFWYDSANSFDYINAAMGKVGHESPAGNDSKAKSFKKKRMLPPGVEVPERRKAETAGFSSSSPDNKPGQTENNKEKK